MGQTPFGESSLVPLHDLSVGDVFYAPVIINTEDLVDPGSQSSTAVAWVYRYLPCPALLTPTNSARAIKHHKRWCIVLVTHDTSVEVAYLATFGNKDRFPKALSKKRKFWYPVKPAKKEKLDYHPLPALNHLAQWVSLRKVHEVPLTSGEFNKKKNVFEFEKTTLSHAIPSYTLRLCCGGLLAILRKWVWFVCIGQVDCNDLRGSYARDFNLKKSDYWFHDINKPARAFASSLHLIDREPSLRAPRTQSRFHALPQVRKMVETEHSNQDPSGVCDPVTLPEIKVGSRIKYQGRGTAWLCR
ncbi:hypothetical protein PAXRUDRAFT_28913 [Paxillus rubicundulus Ve08.2h10]|uniref:Uncharacterized protein n=1 Tax=Paxillus rubicundulus Ve08.2h10 TaxID=930991 RepID=A0A0D0DG18_9AGAM|nr:hypothetical protein PAXRUDRAFT_28913 [Paxillus rubicundulus Ve08.2h10]